MFITGRRKDALDRAVAEIGRNVTAVQGDVANLSDLDRLYDEVRKQNRRLDVIFANAGVAELAPFGTVDEKFYDLHFDANVKGMFFTVQKALPLMNDGGSIILTGSIADVKGFPSTSVYSATKAAVRSFARTWTSELKDRRIRVNTVSPGHIDTPIFNTWQQGEALTKMKEELAKSVPLGRLGDPDEIAKAVSFLASDEASYIAGDDALRRWRHRPDLTRSRRSYTKENIMPTLPDNYFNAYRNVKLTRDADGVLVAEFHSNGGPLTFTAQAHTEVVDAFYRISQDRANKIVILTGAGGDFMVGVDWQSFKNVSDPGVWSQIHDEGVQVLENIANIRVPVIAASEGRAHIHSEYALLANVIVASEGATFQDVGHFAAGVVPGDGVFTAWSYRAGAGRAEAFLLNPQPLAANIAQQWGVVAEVVPNGLALSRAQELARLYLKAPEVTRRDTRVHFIQPLKERLVREVGYGLSLEGASAADLVKSMQAGS